MADPVGKLDIQVGFDLDKGSLVEIGKQVQSFHKSLQKMVAPIGSNKELQPFLPANLKTISKEYQKLTSSLKKTYGFNDKQVKTIVGEYLKIDKSNNIGYKLAQQAGTKKSAKSWTMQQLVSKSDKYELLKKEYQKEGYTGNSLTKKLNEEFGSNYSQSYEKANQTKAFKLLKGEKKTKPSKDWTLQQLISKSDKYELLKKQFEEEGYVGGSLTRKLNEEFGRNYSQSYEKAKNTKAFKLLKEETKLKQKGLPFLKEMGKLGGKGLSATVGKLGVVGGLGYLAYQGFKTNEGIYRDKQTYTGYSKAMREAVGVYGGGQKGIDALSGFYGKFYGFQEKLKRGMADTSIFGKLAQATGDSELINSLMRDDTKTFFTKVLNKAAQLKDAEAYNLFEAIGFSPDVGMDLVQDVKSGEFQKYLAKREKMEQSGEPSGETALKIGEKARKVMNKVKDFGNFLLDAVSLVPDAMSDLDKTPSNKALITTAYRQATGGSNNTYNYNWNNNITATGDMSDAVDGMSTLIDNQKRNLYNEQKVR